MTQLDPRVVVVGTVSPADYPKLGPYSPHLQYPEAPFSDVSIEENSVYHGFREVLRSAGLDSSNFGSERWNPLGEYLHEGQTVLLKPNMVKESHPRHEEGWKWVLTHGSLIRAVADYTWIAIGASGRLVIADAPQTDSSFDQVAELLGLSALKDFYAANGRSLDVIDLRREEWTSKGDVIVERRVLPGDPQGNVAFDLGERSEFVGHPGQGSYYGADYEDSVVNLHHSGGRHEYLIAGSVMECDAIISIPKLKTHKKAGVTVSLKNLIGVNGDKNWLPHHTEGAPESGGDERPVSSQRSQLERRVVRALRSASLRFPTVGPKVFRKVRRLGTPVAGDTGSTIRSGNWYGNDTLWRTCLDLNKIALYGTSDGRLRDPELDQQRTHLVVVDAVISGEGSGPMDPDPVSTGWILFGTHPASVDAACAWMMGFDPDCIPIVREAFRCSAMRIAFWEWRDVRLRVDSGEEWPIQEVPSVLIRRFRPHFGWSGHIERRDQPTT